MESSEFEIGGGSSWPKSVFSPALVKMVPKDYWCHVEKLASAGYSCAGFAGVFLRLCAVPTSNAAVLRNRLSAATLEKLLRMGGVKEEGDGEEL